MFDIPISANHQEQFKDLSSTNKWFSNVKQRIKNHLGSERHISSEESLAIIEQRKDLSKNKKMGAAINVTRQVCTSIYLGDSFNSITARLSSLHMSGVNIGQKNHTKFIAAEIVDIADEFLKKHVKSYLTTNLEQTGQPPPFSVITDKITTNHRSRQMVSLRMVNMSTSLDEDEPLLLNLYMGHPPCHEYTGNALARDIIAQLKEFGVLSRDIKRCFVSLGIDGQYVSLNVLLHFLNESMVDTSGPLALKYWDVWDPAHVEERAILDGFTKVTILKKQTDILQEVLKHVQYGKSYEQLLKCADEMNHAILQPKIFKTKKFVVNCELVYKTFYQDYPVIISLLQKQLPDSDAESFMRQVTGSRFLLTTTFLYGMSTVLSVFSSLFQSYDSLIHDLLNHHDMFVSELSKISSLMVKKEFDTLYGFETFKEAVKAVQTGVFKGIPTIGANSLHSHYIGTLLPQSIYQKLADFTNSIKSGFQKRMIAVSADVHLIAAQRLLNSLLCQINPHVFPTEYDAEDLRELFCMENTVLLEVGVKKLQKLVFDTSRTLTRKELSPTLRQILVRPELYNDLPEEMLQGLLRVLCIATSEAIAETHGSMIDNLHLRYCKTDVDDMRVQRELRVKLMAPTPCTPDGEKFVLAVAKILCGKHHFLSHSGQMGVAIKNQLSQKYKLPLRF